MELTWSTSSITECPGCGATTVVGIMSLCATCRYCGFFYVDGQGFQGWYSSRLAFAIGQGRIA